jgi:hypothetical protein
MSDMSGKDVQNELHIAPRPRITMSVRRREEDLTIGSIMKSLSTPTPVEEAPKEEEKKEEEPESPIIKKPMRKKIIPKA